MTVLDASAAVAALLNSGPARTILAEEDVHVPHLVDAEVASALRRLVLTDDIGADTAFRLLHLWQQLGLRRHAMVGLLDRVFELRASISPYDACYVALAEALGTTLVTADGRLARANGLRCPLTVVPR
ncbi:MAG TPA: type II toxin-antitoxin system VapC family toxin [Acidimicrobiales bacterium]|nr:type II toxin-antitoxin system VapC family toxin [Acidimicrobiales bacterium]